MESHGVIAAVVMNDKNDIDSSGVLSCPFSCEYCILLWCQTKHCIWSILVYNQKWRNCYSNHHDDPGALSAQLILHTAQVNTQTHRIIHKEISLSYMLRSILSEWNAKPFVALSRRFSSLYKNLILLLLHNIWTEQYLHRYCNG